MSRLKVFIPVTLVMVVISGLVASSSALAAGNWFVSGTKLASGATVALATTARVDESTNLTVPSLKIKLTCTGGSSELLTGVKPFIQGPNTGGAESLIFNGCSEIEPTGCTIEEEIPTEPVAATLESGPGSLEDRVTFAPKGGKVFADIVFTGSCSLSGTKPVDGKVKLAAPYGQARLRLQPLAPLGTTENNSLELAGSKGYLENGRAFLALASGAEWNFGAGGGAAEGRIVVTPTGLARNGVGGTVNLIIQNIGGANEKVESAKLKPPAGGKLFEVKAGNGNACFEKKTYVATEFCVVKPNCIKEEIGPVEVFEVEPAASPVVDSKLKCP